MVILGHIPDPFRAALDPFPLATHHFTGVGLFFALSGFVIAHSYAERLRARPRDVGRYLLLRLGRVYPAYLVALIAWIPFGVGSGQGRHSLVAHALMSQSWSTERSIVFGWNPVAWSISTEFFFYLAFPLVAILTIRTLRRQHVVAATWLFLWIFYTAVYLIRFGSIGAIDYWIYVFPPFRFIEFMLGVLAWRLYSLRRGPLPRTVGPLAAGALAGALLLLPGPSISGGLYPLVFVPLFSLTLYWLSSEPSIVQRALDRRWMERLGDASYSLYLLHLLGIWLALRGLGGWESGTVAASVVFTTVAVGLSTVLALLSYRIVEAPFRTATRRWARRTADSRRNSPGWPSH